MKRVLPAAVLVSVLASAAPALADPPLDKNKNAGVLTFDCSRETETQTFETVGIAHNAAIVGQLLDGTGVVRLTHVEINGQVIFDSPGQAGRSDLWTCSIEEIPGAFVRMFVTPRG
jgi:hypothetical protein